MDKRYQVFVSSTFLDLKEERQAVMQTLMEMDCIPAGMELFPAADEEQWEFIKKVIDQSDYYLLIIGGRYGSVTSEGISYTEKEFDYAVEKGIRVIALLHQNPNSIEFYKCEQDQVLRDKLDDFKKKVSNRRLVKKWDGIRDLASQVSLSLSRAIKEYPSIGWVRADRVSKSEPQGLLDLVTDKNASDKIHCDDMLEKKHIIDEMGRVIRLYYEVEYDGAAVFHGDIDVSLNDCYQMVIGQLYCGGKISEFNSVISSKILQDYESGAVFLTVTGPDQMWSLIYKYVSLGLVHEREDDFFFLTDAGKDYYANLRLHYID